MDVRNLLKEIDEIKINGFSYNEPFVLNFAKDLIYNEYITFDDCSKTNKVYDFKNITYSISKNGNLTSLLISNETLIELLECSWNNFVLINETNLFTKLECSEDRIMMIKLSGRF